MRHIVLLVAIVLFPVEAARSRGGTALPGLDAFNPWQAVNEGLTADSVWALAAHPDGLLFAGTEAGVFRSMDEGAFWEEINTGLDAGNVTSLAIDAGGTLYAGTHSSGVFRSRDDGDTWEAINTGLPGLLIGHVATDEHGAVYAGLFLGGFYRSQDEGDTWEPVHDVGLDNPFVPALAVDHDNVVFAGTDAGV